MAEQDLGRYPNVRLNYGLKCLTGWCQGQLAVLTMRPEDYNEYVRLMGRLCDDRDFIHAFQRQMSALLEDPDYAHLRVYYDVLYRDYTEEVNMEDNPLYFFPVALCVVLNAIICNALLGSLRNLPR